MQGVNSRVTAYLVRWQVWKHTVAGGYGLLTFSPLNSSMFSPLGYVLSCVPNLESISTRLLNSLVLFDETHSLFTHSKQKSQLRFSIISPRQLWDFCMSPNQTFVPEKKKLVISYTTILEISKWALICQETKVCNQKSNICHPVVLSALYSFCMSIILSLM